MARERLADTIGAFERTDMRADAVAARRQLGRLQGGDEGRRLVTEADAFFTGEQVMKPERFAAMLAPGFFE